MAALNFNANEHKPQVGFQPIPAGDYLAAIVESNTKPTKSGSGEMLVLKFQVCDGEHKGRHLFVNLNLKNSSQAAVKMAQAELSAICRAVKVMTPNDSVEFHNIPMFVTVGVRRDKDGNAQNEIKGYKARGEAALTSQQQTAAANSNAAPW